MPSSRLALCERSPPAQTRCRYSAASLADLSSLFAGLARAIRHQCPQGSVHDGYNELRLKQLPGEPEQKITWLELRIEPR